jgi:hypothetical protein
MARIQLRDTTIYIQDGLSGSAAINLPGTALAATPVAITVIGDTGVDQVQTIARYQSNPSGGTFTLTIDLTFAPAFTTAAIAYNANAATIEGAIDTAATLASVPGWTNGDITVAGGALTTTAVTLTFDGTSVDELNHSLVTINPASLTGVTMTGATVVAMDAIVVNADVTTKMPVGARFTVASETGGPVHTITARLPAGDSPTHFTFTPALAAGVVDNAVVTVLPQRVTVKIGEGDMSWTESKEYIYDRDRDLLDTVREGQEQPVEVELAFIFDYVTTESGQAITPVDALKRTGEATEWVSSSSDQCEPYAVDLYVLHAVPCGTDEDQDFLFQDFRYESLEYSIQDAAIAVSGRCNVSNVVTTRADLA